NKPDTVADAGRNGKPGPGPTQPAGPAKPRLDTAFVAANFNAAVVVHPRRMLESSALSPLPQEKLFASLTALGVDPRQVERAVLLFDALPSNGVFSGGAVFRLAKPLDVSKVVKAVFPNATEAREQGTPYLKLDFQVPEGPLCFHQPDEKTVVAAPELAL